LRSLLKDYERPEDLTGPDGVLKELFRRLIETAAGAGAHRVISAMRSMTGGARPRGTRVTALTPKTLILSMVRSRWRFPGPQLEFRAGDRGQRARRTSMLRRQDHLDVRGGMTYEEIRGHLAEIYGRGGLQDVSSPVTDQVLEDVKAWQSLPWDACYPVVVDRRAGHQGPRRRCRAEPARVSGPGPESRGRKEALALVMGAVRSRQVLAQGPVRPAEPGGVTSSSCAATG